MADAVLDRAVDLARQVAVELAEDPADVGEYLGAVEEGDRLVSHRFASLQRGYHGWEWTVTVARVPRGRTVSVSEAALLPGPGAVLAKPWVPWADRLRPGDVGPGDVLPFRPDDPRLVPGWKPSGDPQVDEVAIEELALARERILSPQGRDEAAQRWYRGSRGPTSPGALASEAACASCGFLVPLQGSLGHIFGVCANEWSPDDGKVVSFDHGCGAHSQTDVTVASEWPEPDPIVDDEAVEVVAVAPAAGDVAGTGSEAAMPDEPPAAVSDEPAAMVPDEPADEIMSDEPVGGAWALVVPGDEAVPDEPAAEVEVDVDVPGDEIEPVAAADEAAAAEPEEPAEP
jgi:hypothetical protein